MTENVESNIPIGIDEIAKRLSADSSTLILVGIDGCGGAGKSTITDRLANQLPGSQIVHIDDFYKPKEARVEVTEDTSVHVNFEFDRLIEQVIKPLQRGEIATFQTPNGEEVTISPFGRIIFEGLGTLGESLKDYFDYKIWINTPEETRRERGIKRDSKDWTKIWDTQYLPQDARYVEEQHPDKQADFILINK